MEVYLDNAATTKPYEEVILEVSKSMGEFYMNPSSLHKLGIKGEKKLNQCREIFSKELNCLKEEIYFTAGGAEGNNLVLKGLAKKDHHIILTSFEHSSLLKTSERLIEDGVRVTYLELDSKGQIDIQALKETINKNTVLISIMHINNEIGSIQNLKEIGKAIKSISSRAKFHVDAVQSFGKYEIDVKECEIDMLTCSSHKINGPKGVGFIYIRKGLNIAPLIEGGEQEGGLRAGTHNLPGIIGMTKALEIWRDKREENYNKVIELKSYMIERLNEINEIKILSPLNEWFSPYILNVSFTGTRGEVFLHFLEEEGIYVSTGSACSSKGRIGKGSYVLKAIGLGDKDVEGGVRFSFSPDNTKEEIDYTIDALKKGLKFLRRIKK